MLEKFVRLATYGNPLEAEMAKNYLEAEGITVLSAGAASAGAFAGFGVANLELHVPASQVEKACDLLEAFAEQESTARAELSEENSTAIREASPEWREGDAEIETDVRSGPPPGDLSGGSDGGEFASMPDPELTSDDDSPDGEWSIQATADSVATRAWRAALFGAIGIPFSRLILFSAAFTVYSVWLLAGLASMEQPLSPLGKVKVGIALAVNSVVLVLVAIILLAFLAN
jgi:hypothetical protein